jgi:hypothetical protein
MLHPYGTSVHHNIITLNIFFRCEDDYMCYVSRFIIVRQTYTDSYNN